MTAIEREELDIREASEGDLPALREISSQTWDGEDYLAQVAAGWMNDGGLYVGLLNEAVVGAVKVSLLPCGVVWLEGLRVHPRYRGRGFGKILAEYSMHRALELMRNGEAELVEFVTYVKNDISIGISRKLGFRLQERFFVLSRPTLASGRECRAIDELRKEDLACFPGHIPAGWVMVLKCPESLAWLRSRMTVHGFGEARFMFTRGDSYFVPLGSSLDDPGDFLRGCNACAAAADMDRHDVVLHESMRPLLAEARRAGFGMWEEVDGPNMLLFRFSQEFLRG
ncbi:GNAT family N-acetyltransferase [Candidatus Fermentibacteria bacterium]|nr:GNAT family N-acetyltransferase [Candidatus Fermentibacteria bacterium]